MKSTLIKTAAIMGLATISTAFAYPVIIDAPVKHVYIPAGFDNNDNVEVVVTGEFPSLCFTKNITEVKVDGDKIEVRVSALYNLPGTSGEFDKCGQMVVPFKEVITVGNLQGGNYKISVNKGSEYELNDKMLIAESSTNAVDEYIYANVDYIEKSALTSSTIKLKGYNPSDCLKFDHIEMINNKKDTISLLPIMKKVSDFCPLKMVPFTQEVKLDTTDMKVEDVLIHARVMDGKSVNTILNLK